MRTLISTHFISLDGVVDSPGGEPGYRHSGWTFQVAEDPEAYSLKEREMEEATAMLLGRASYDAFAPVWPKVDFFQRRYNGLPKYVVSTTLSEDDLVTDWGDITILRSVDEVAELKETDGGPISMHGSASLHRALSDAGLVDRYHLLVFPFLLGAGMRLFSETDREKQRLELIDSESYGNGVQKLVYDVVR
ncbi:dihydrofolate reductase family protein [Nocardioides dilutus]